MFGQYEKFKKDSFVYTSLDDAKDEIQKRWNDEKLKKKVAIYLRDFPDIFQTKPHSVLFRNITTPDHEFLNFIALSDKIGLNPLGLEYTEDKFSTRNSDKLCLAKMAIFEKRAKNGDAIMHYETVIDIKANDNKRFSDITTIHGNSLVDFHHKLLREHSDVPTYDLSEWLKNNGGHALEYYKKVFAFFIAHGVLFEYFVTNDSEEEFEQKVTLPAFVHVWETFRVKPLIVKLLPDHKDKFWWCYPDNAIE